MGPPGIIFVLHFFFKIGYRIFYIPLPAFKKKIVIFILFLSQNILKRISLEKKAEKFPSDEAYLIYLLPCVEIIFGHIVHSVLVRRKCKVKKSSLKVQQS